MRDLLLTVHYGLAAWTKVDRLKLTEEEAQRYAEAIKRVEEFHPIVILSPETRAWINLAMVMGFIYIPRIRKDKKEVREQGPKVVTIPVTQPVSGDVNRMN